MSKALTRDLDFHDTKGFKMRRQTVTAVSGAATKKGKRVQVTSEALTTAAGAVYTLTLTNSEIKADSMVFAAVKYGTATAGEPNVTRITPANGSVVIIVKNIHASNALDGTIILDVLVIPNTVVSQ